MTPQPWHDGIEELLGAYALDAVDADERLIVDHHVDRCAPCEDEVAGHWEAAATLTPGGPAPGGVWNRVFAGLEEPPPPLHLAPVVNSRSRTPARTMLTAVTALAAAIVGIFGVRVVDQGRRLDRMQTTMAGDGLRRSAVAALADPAAVRLALTAADTGLTAQTAILPDGRGYVMADQLPRLAPDRAYQLWVLIGQERISAGILGSSPTTAAFHVAQRFDGLAITAESAGGVAASDNAPVVFGRVAPS